ncbi:MAG TPA: oxaloacetate decarboxylase [Kiloniellales bacterium]|nr:oxaloacetate decarboxylase [Kiloniellales bacterium]
MSETSSLSPSRRLRRLLDGREILVAPGVFDGLSAHLARRAGFPVIYASGGAIARSIGYPDLGLIAMPEILERLGQIVAAAEVPVIADADTGYGTALHARRTLRAYEQCGLAGLHIEDQGFPKRCGHLAGKSLVPTEEMAGKIAAAADARRDPDFVIIARTDAIAVEGFEPALERARAYRAAGADVLFVEAPETDEQIAAVPEALDCPVMINMFRGGRTPFTPVARLQELGYRLVIVPSDLQRAVIRTMEQVLAAIRRDGDSAAVQDLLAPLPERDTVVEMDRWLAWAERYGG